MSSAQAKITTVKAPVLPSQTTPEQRYWRSYTNTQLVKEHNAVTHIAFNPVAPHDFAVTSSTRVQIFSSKTRQVIKNFSRFKDIVYSGEFRHDGKLLVASDASGLVSVYDAYNPRNQLVTLKPSSHPTHVTRFHPTDPTILLTASDDRVVRLYDIAQTQKPIISFSSHEDYVRSAIFIPGTQLVATGSYDGFVRLFDVRSNKAIVKLNQLAPVEDILSISPTGLVTAGGPSVKVWDLAANRLARDMGNFTKTVTCLAQDSGNILAGSLDGHVKVFDKTNWDVKFGWKFSAGVLSCAVSEKHFAAGLTSGLLAIKTKKIAGKQQTQKKVKSNNFARMMRGSEYHGEMEHRVHTDKVKTKKLRQFEKHIQAFKWSEALDSAFISGMSKELSVTVLEELRKRGKIRVALHGRDESGLEPLLNWCLKSVDDVRSVNIIADWLAITLDMYGSVIEKSPVLEDLVISLKKKVVQEIEKAKEATRIEGMLQLLTN